MKKIHLLWVFILLVTFACKKKEEDVKPAPSINIDNSSNIINVIAGDIVNLQVNLVAENGLANLSVLFNDAVNNDYPTTIYNGEKASSYNFNYSIPKNTNTGDIQVKFIVKDKKNLSVEKSITIKVNPPFTQFASSVLGFSTEYRDSPGDWSAFQALGEPNVYPNYGDIEEAWASASSDGQREHLVLGFSVPQTVYQIEIFETYNPGAIDTLYVRNSETKQWNQIWQNSAVAAPQESRIFSININQTNYKVDAIRLAINSPAISGWNEIDAVRISGKK